MSDTVGALLGGGGKNQPKKEGDVYVSTDQTGNTVYYPASHYEKGQYIPFGTKEAASKANSQDVATAKTGSTTPPILSGTTSDSSGSTASASAGALAGGADASKSGTKKPYSLVDPNKKPNYVLKLEQTSGKTYVFDEQAGQWVPKG